jgi:O-antigen/teichoic acid export membrane protein/Ser/Thr protein kinase RdoA (MazF antagonist)
MTAADFVTGTRQRLAGLWRQSLVRTAHLLVMNSVLNAGTGVAYWLLAARLNPPAAVGINSAAISAMMLLAGIAQLNLMSTLLRFVPAAGAAAGTMIRGAYLIGAGLSGVAAIVFLGGLGVWAPRLQVLLGSPLAAIGFVVFTMCWALFVMQDSALIAVRRAAAVPVENSSFAVLKIVLVVVFSLSAAGAAVWLSWTWAMVITVAGTSWYLFRRAVPSFAAARPQVIAQVESARELGRFIGPDYIGAVAYLAATSLVPLLVLDFTTARKAAVFALSWSICTALYAVAISFGQSLVAHGAVRGDQLDQYHRQAMRQTMRLLVPVVILSVAFASFGLSFFGPWYASQGTLTLRLLALSALPNAVVSLAVSRARAARQTVTAMVLLVTLCCLVLGLTVLLVPRLGIEGGGIAWLVAQLLVAAVVLTRSGVAAVRGRRVRSAEAGVPGTMLQAALADGGWQCEQPAAPTASDSAVVMVHRPEGETGVLKLAATSKGAASLRREHAVLTRLQSEERLGPWRELLPVPLSSGDVGDGAFLLTSRLPGQDARQVAPDLSQLLTPAAVNAITPLHRASSLVQVLDSVLLKRLVDEPIDQLRTAVRRKDPVDRLAAFLHEQMAGRWAMLGWTHGDYYPGNVLVGPVGRVTGIVDWSGARDDDLVALDIAFWLLTVPRPGQPREIGARVAGRLDRGPCWQPAEADLLTSHAHDAQVSGKSLLLLAWLRHVTDNLAKSDRYAASPVWARRNIAPVLRRMDELGDDGAGREP